MHRDGLFFDPLQDEADAPPLPEPEPARPHQPSAAELQRQRQRELARVQDDLKRMAQGSSRR